MIKEYIQITKENKTKKHIVNNIIFYLQNGKNKKFINIIVGKYTEILLEEFSFEKLFKIAKKKYEESTNFTTLFLNKMFSDFISNICFLKNDDYYDLTNKKIINIKTFEKIIIEILDKNFKSIEENKKQFYKKINFKNCFEYIKSKILIVESISNNPYEKEFFVSKCNLTGKDVLMLNTYIDFYIKKEKGSFDTIKELMNFVTNDENGFDVICSWFYYILKGKRTEICPIFYGEQGSGKGTLTDLIFANLLGYANFEKISDSILEDKFNKFVTKRLVVINEMGDSKKENVKITKKIKEWITDVYIGVRQMNVDSYTIQNFCNFCICTNNLDSVILEGNDRRWIFFEQLKNFSQENYIENFEEKILKEIPKFYNFLLEEFKPLTERELRNYALTQTNEIKEKTEKKSLTSSKYVIKSIIEGKKEEAIEEIRNNAYNNYFSYDNEVIKGEDLTCGSKLFDEKINKLICYVEKSFEKGRLGTDIIKIIMDAFGEYKNFHKTTQIIEDIKVIANAKMKLRQRSITGSTKCTHYTINFKGEKNK